MVAATTTTTPTTTPPTTTTTPRPTPTTRWAYAWANSPTVAATYYLLLYVC